MNFEDYMLAIVTKSEIAQGQSL